MGFAIGGPIAKWTDIVIKSTGYTITDTDNVGTILFDDTSGDPVCTLPTSADNQGRVITIKNISTDKGEVTIEGEGAETIDGVANIVLYDEGDTIEVQSDGSNWNVISEYPKQQLQDFTVIGEVGDVAQQAAGHIWDSDTEDIAYYPFLNGDLTDDSEGTYDLINNNTVSDADGITGSDYAAEFNGTNQYFHNGTLLDTTPTNIGISFWMKPDDGNPTAIQYLFEKQNVENEDSIGLALLTTGELRFYTEQANAGSVYLSVPNVFADGVGSWTNIVINWSTTYGKRVWINGALAAIDSTETTLMGNGTGSNFTIGSRYYGDLYFDGKISMFKVQDIEYTQADIDYLYSVRYARPDLFPSNQVTIEGQYQVGGDSTIVRPLNWNGIEVKRTADYIYRSGFTNGFGLGSTDKLKIIGSY